MKNRKLIATVAGGALLAGVLATPAMAVGDSTEVTFNLDNGALSITAPAPVDIESWSQSLSGGTTVSGDLGNTTVTDERNVTTGWSVSASSTAFEQVVNSVVVDTVPATAVGIAIQEDNIVSALLGTLTNTLENLEDGLFVVTEGTTGAAGGAIGNLSGNAVSTLLGGLSGLLRLNAANEVVFDPTVTVTVPPDTLDGDYTATITQTVV